MTTIRLSASEKRALEKARGILERIHARRVSRGEAVAALAEFALRHRASLAASQDEAPIRDDDPFFDVSIVFDLGRTDERTHDRLLYGRR